MLLRLPPVPVLLLHNHMDIFHLGAFVPAPSSALWLLMGMKRVTLGIAVPGTCW
jgi:hypothetical protein